MRSARRGAESRKSRLRVVAWAGGWFAPVRRARGTRQAAAFRHHRALFEPLEPRVLLASNPCISLDNGVAASFIGGQDTWVQIPIRYR
jgi:hypothetical protein